MSTEYSCAHSIGLTRSSPHISVSAASRLLTAGMTTVPRSARAQALFGNAQVFTTTQLYPRGIPTVKVRSETSLPPAS
jgi:hypothetical protein